MKLAKIQGFIHESGLRLGEELKKKKRIIEDLERSVKIIKFSR